MHFCSQKAHLIDIQRLPFNVFDTHIDLAFHPEEGGHRRRRDPVLPCAGFGDHARFAHPFRQKHLPQAVIDLMRSGMIQVFPLQVNFCTA